MRTDGLLRGVAGWVTSTGLVVAGTGFACRKVGTGSYQISLDPEFSYYSVQATPISSAVGVTLTLTTARQFSTFMFTPSTGAAVDTGFTFLALVR